MGTSGSFAQVVLAADDNPLNLELIQGCLSEIACNFVSAANGEQALSIVRAAPPDLVLLDVMMPKLNGFEVCRRIRGLPGGDLIPVVLLTALGAVEDRVRGLEAGADEFLVKPIDRLELVARVRSLLRLKELRDGLDDAKSVIFALARAVEAKSGRIATGVDSVGRTARRVGVELGLAGRHLDDLEWGGAIRDIGKIGVPDAILQKPAPLTPAEYDLVRKHVLIGEQIATPLQSTRHLVPIIRHHHEWVNGAGYPDGLAGDAIPLGARVVAVCDAFHALTSDRPYRKRRTAARALAVLAAGAGSQWDCAIVTLLQGIVGGNRPAGAARRMRVTGL